MDKMIVAAIAAVIFVNLLLWIFLVPWLINRRIRNFQNELVNKHYDEVETMYRKMRGWRHDYHNHVQVLKAHMELKQYKEVQNYLDMLESDLRTVDTVLKTGNVMVDAILNSKLTMIKERDIAVDATAVMPQEIMVAGTDLSVLIGNLLDNAMEACLKLPKEERFVRIYIDIIKKQLYICVTNSMAGHAKKRDSLYLSGKGGLHGLGLWRIDGIVHKYNGYINRQDEPGVFATEILLPLV